MQHLQVRVRLGLERLMLAILAIGLGILFNSSVVAGEIQYRVKAGVHSQYILKSGVIAHNGPVSQIEAIVALKNGFYGGVNNTMSLGGTFYKQLDFLVGYKKSFGSGQLWDPTLDATLSYFTLGDWSQLNDDRFVLDLRLEFAKVPIVQPYVAFRYFGSIGEVTIDGEFFWLGASRTQPLGLKPFAGEVSLRADVSFAFATEGSLGRQGGFVYSRYQASLNVPISKHLSLNLFCMVQVPAGDQNGRKIDFVSQVEKVFGGFVSVEF